MKAKRVHSWNMELKEFFWTVAYLKKTHTQEDRAAYLEIIWKLWKEPLWFHIVLIQFFTTFHQTQLQAHKHYLFVQQIFIEHWLHANLWINHWGRNS